VKRVDLGCSREGVPSMIIVMAVEAGIPCKCA